MAHRLWTKFDRDWGWNLARILAYTLIQSLFATIGLELIMLALSIRLLAPGQERAFDTQLQRLLPDHVIRAALGAFMRSLRSASPWLLLAGLPITLWYGTRFFVVLESVLSVIFRRRQRATLHQNIVGLAMFALLSALLPVIVVSAAITPHLDLDSVPINTHSPVSHALLTQLSADPVIPWLGVLAGILANVIILLTAYSRVTPGGVPIRACWPAALLSACLAQGYIMIFPYYVSNVLHPDHFGAVAGFALIILAFYFTYALLIVIGAELASWRAGYIAATADIPTLLARAYERPQPEPTASSPVAPAAPVSPSTPRPGAAFTPLDPPTHLQPPSIAPAAATERVATL